jgi:hypothetical protein
MIFLYYKQKKFKLNYFTKYFINYNYLLDLGLHLGGNYKYKHMTNSSLIYGFKQKQSILNLSQTLFELKKVLKIIETIAFKRGVLYYINHSITFQLTCQNVFFCFNKYLLKQKKTLLEYIYNFSKWSPGFLTNNSIYFNSLKHKLKFPRLPHFGFLNDFLLNYIALKEFKKIWIPYSTLNDITTFNITNVFYTLTSNGKSIDSTYFYLFNCLNSFYIGYHNEKLKFKFKYLNQIIISIKWN